MKVKIDTKEKMQVFTIEEDKLAANMTEDLEKLFKKCLEETVSNVIVNFKNVEEIDKEVAASLSKVQQSFYDEGHSMVYCEFTKKVEDFLDNEELLEIMNVTPTESEAWDIVQMEEIERELL